MGAGADQATQKHSLATVNFFVLCTGGYQVSRVLMYQSEQKNNALGTEAKDEAARQSEVIKVVVEHPEQAVQRAGESAKK